MSQRIFGPNTTMATPWSSSSNSSSNSSSSSSSRRWWWCLGHSRSRSRLTVVRLLGITFLFIASMSMTRLGWWQFQYTTVPSTRPMLHSGRYSETYVVPATNRTKKKDSTNRSSSGSSNDSSSSSSQNEEDPERNPKLNRTNSQRNQNQVKKTYRPPFNPFDPSKSTLTEKQRERIPSLRHVPDQVVSTTTTTTTTTTVTTTPPLTNGRNVAQCAPPSTPLETSTRCETVPLPLTERSPVECWPRVVWLASFPTNGNGVVRKLYGAATDLYSYTQYPKNNKHVFLRVNPSDSDSDNDTNNNNTNTSHSMVPLYVVENDIGHCHAWAGRTALVKTHFNINGDADMDPEIAISKFLSPPSIQTAQYGNTHNNNNSNNNNNNTTYNTNHNLNLRVVRMARNPGDQLLRNVLRWPLSKACFNKDPDEKEACYQRFRGQARFCDKLKGPAEKWLTFHHTWDRMFAFVDAHTTSTSTSTSTSTTATPTPTRPNQLILNYERFFTQPERALSNLLDFVGEEPESSSNKSKQNLTEVVRQVRSPAYPVGAFLVEFCGLKVARTLHEQTKHVSHALGYGFDHDTGRWYLSS